MSRVGYGSAVEVLLTTLRFPTAEKAREFWALAEKTGVVKCARPNSR